MSSKKKILIINTGGLQSVDGFNKRLKEKMDNNEQKQRPSSH